MAAYGAWRVLSAAPEEVSLSAAVAALEQEQLSDEGAEKTTGEPDLAGVQARGAQEGRGGDPRRPKDGHQHRHRHRYLHA